MNSSFRKTKIETPVSYSVRNLENETWQIWRAEEKWKNFKKKFLPCFLIGSENSENFVFSCHKSVMDALNINIPSYLWVALFDLYM